MRRLLRGMAPIAALAAWSGCVWAPVLIQTGVFHDGEVLAPGATEAGASGPYWAADWRHGLPAGNEIGFRLGGAGNDFQLDTASIFGAALSAGHALGTWGPLRAAAHAELEGSLNLRHRYRGLKESLIPSLGYDPWPWFELFANLAVSQAQVTWIHDSESVAEPEGRRTHWTGDLAPGLGLRLEYAPVSLAGAVNLPIPKRWHGVDHQGYLGLRLGLGF